MRFTSASGSEAVAKLRPASMARLNGARGPNARLRLKPVELLSSCAAMRAIEGSCRTRWTVCELLTLSAVPTSATSPGWSGLRRRGREADDVRLHERRRRARQHVAQEEVLERAQEILEDRELRHEGERDRRERYDTEERGEGEAARGAGPADAV